MIDIGQRKPLVSPSSGDGEGLFSDTPHPAHQLTPSEPPRAGCPVAPRPRNARAYRAACDAAQGDPVIEVDACTIVPGMRAWSGSTFLTVAEARHLTVGDIPGMLFATAERRRHPFVVLRLADACGSGWRFAELDAPVYVLAPAPDACNAPDAGTTADDPTAAAR